VFLLFEHHVRLYDTHLVYTFLNFKYKYISTVCIFQLYFRRNSQQMKKAVNEEVDYTCKDQEVFM